MSGSPETTTDVEHAVREVFALTLAVTVAPGADLLRENHSRWDSIKQMEIMFMVEEQCGVHFTEEELGRLNSFSAIVAHCRERRAARN